MKMTWHEWVLISAIVLCVLGAAVGFSKSSRDFKRVCDEARGTTVWDGRQYQCIKP